LADCGIYGGGSSLLRAAAAMAPQGLPPPLAHHRHTKLLRRGVRSNDRVVRAASSAGSLMDEELQRENNWGPMITAAGRTLLLMFAIPFVMAQSVKSVFIIPCLQLHFEESKATVPLSHHQREHMAEHLAKYEHRLHYQDLVKATHTSPKEMNDMLKAKAAHLHEHECENSMRAMANMFGSLVYVALTISIITVQKNNVRKLLGDFSDKFFGLDSATQAFILLLVTDLAVGYHSADGWEAVIQCVVEHYGQSWHSYHMFARIFVATVPVALDVCFKYWVFTSLRRLSPSTQIILDEIEE